MNPLPPLALILGALLAADTRFHDPFRKELQPGWSWIREDASAWRMTDSALEVRLQPGNMWGPANNARNLLVRAAPDPAAGDVDVSVTVHNVPRVQWEQCDLVWYYSDSNQVKCGQELVDGKLCIVMGREAADRARTIKIVPLDTHTVSLRLAVKGNNITGFFRRPDDKDWQEVGTCDLPALKDVQPRIALQFYNGPKDEERWARITDFRMSQTGQ